MTPEKAEQALACLPFGCHYEQGKFCVPCTLPYMQIMRKLGYEAMSPILIDYDWPIMPGRKPLDHQKHMASFMTLHPRCFNLSDMGTMKTLSVLWAWDYLMKVRQVKKVMIACTLSTMVDVWKREIELNFLSRRKAVIVHGDRAKRVKALSQESDFYIINHDGLSIGCKHEEVRGVSRFVAGPLAVYLAANPDINGVTIDEGAEFRHTPTDAYKSLKFALRDKPYFNWLTGTPTPLSPMDAYAQARMVRMDYAENFVTFRDRTMLKKGNFKWLPKPDGYAIAASILTPSIRYDIEDCVELPECVTIDRSAELSPAQKKSIEEIKKTLKTMVDGGTINAINEASLRIKLLQIAQGAVYGQEHVVHKVDCSPRLAVLEELIEQAHHKIIVFASLTNVVNMVCSELSKKYTVEKVNGDVSPSKRSEIFRNFRSSENPRIIVADPGCMAHGLELTAAATTIWYGPPNDPGIYPQANKRMDRPGQKNNMVVARISATPVERGIWRRIDSCASLQGVMLDLIKGE